MSRIQLRRDTAANWTADNPVLAQGELGIETDTKLLKFGDGSTAWATLPYVSALSTVDNGNGTATLSGGSLSPGAGVASVDGMTGTVNLATKYAQLANNLSDLADIPTARNNLGTAPFVTPEQYGAAGDGVTDDSTAINNALTASAGGVCVLEAVTYYTGTTSLNVPIGTTIVGKGRDLTTISYAGTGAAVQMANRSTAEQKSYIRIADLTIIAPAATTGINAKGFTHSEIERVYVRGVADNATIPAGGFGIYIDGSYGASIGAWHNTIRHCWVAGWDTCIEFTGTAGAGQANENLVEQTRCSWHNVGVSDDVGDHVSVVNCDLSTSNTGAVGVYMNATSGRVRDCRFEQVATAVHVGPAAVGCTIAENSFFNSGGTAVKFDAGSQSCRVYGNSYAATVTRIVDNTAATADGAALHYYGTGNLIPIQFAYSSVTAAMSGVQIPVAGLSALTLAQTGRAYQIRGVSARLQAAATAGTMTITPTITTTPSATLAATLTTGASTTSRFQAMGKDANNGTSSIGVQVSTTADFAPTGGQLSIIVWVEFTN